MGRYSLGILLAFVWEVMGIAGVHAQTLKNEAEHLVELGVTNPSADTIQALIQSIDSLSMSGSLSEGTTYSQILQARYIAMMGSHDSAVAIINRLESSLRASREPTTFAYGVLMFQKARLYEMGGHYSVSKLAHLEAVRIFSALGKNSLQIEALHSLGHFERNNGNYDAALKHFTSAIELSRKFGLEVSGRQRLLIAIANLYIAIKNYDAAFKFCRQALALQSKDAMNANPFLNNQMGDLCFYTQKFDSAVYYYNRGILAARQAKKPLAEFYSMFKIADVHYAQGDYQKAINLVDQSFAQFPDLLPIAKITPMLLQARSHFYLNNLETSTRLARQVLSMAKKNQAKLVYVDAADLMARIFARKRNVDSVAHYYTQKELYKDSVFNFESQTRFSKLYAELESLSKQREIESLEEEKKVKAAENHLLLITLISGALISALAVTLIILVFLNRQKKHLIKNFELHQQLTESESKLQQQTIRMIHINNGVNQVLQELKKGKFKSEDRDIDFKQVLSTIQMNTSLEKEWENFDRYFGTAHRGFYERLNALFPGLTIMEKRLAGLIKMNLTNKEIASILNIDPKSVVMAKYRLKKRMSIDKDSDINLFLHSFPGVESNI